jgi:hypothetical protein
VQTEDHFRQSCVVECIGGASIEKAPPNERSRNGRAPSAETKFLKHAPPQDRKRASDCRQCFRT